MIFGGRIQPINGRVDGLHGLCVYDWPGDGDQEYKSADGQIYTIPTSLPGKGGRRERDLPSSRRRAMVRSQKGTFMGKVSSMALDIGQESRDLREPLNRLLVETDER
jgi:hypothetical protein